MEVPLTPDLESQLSRLAAQQGRASEILVLESVERMLNHDGWFIRQVEKGLATADRGERVEHHQVLDTIRKRYPG